MSSGEDTVAGASSDGPHRRATGPSISRGDLVGRYVILGELGAGGMGVVYAAYDPELDRRVAIKHLLPHGDPARSRSRLQREGQAMAKLSHPNVVNVHDVVTVDDRVFIAMEFVTGRTLTRWLAEAPRSWREVVDVFVHVGRGLAAAHREGLLHRDVKPDNVMIDDHGRVRVMDFGLARSVAADSLTRTEDERPEPDEIVAERRGDSAREVVTRAGAIVGTPAYMAPEQFEGRIVDGRTDQFAFCVSLWEALYGERPFAGDDPLQLVLSVTQGRRRPAPKGADVPSWLRRVVERGLSVEPAERWPTIDALIAELSRDLGRRRARWLGTGAFLLLASVGAAGWWSAQSQRCTGAAEELVGVWDEGRRGGVETAVLATNVSFAPGVWAGIGPRLDAWAEEWAAMHTEACEATRRRGEQSEAALDLRMGCLSQAKLALEAAADVLSEATPTVVRNAHQIVGGLPRLDRCADLAALTAAVPPPEPEEAEAVQALQSVLARAKAHREGGDYDAALAAVRRADAALEDLAYEPVRAGVWYELSAVHDARGEYPEAEAALWRAQRQGAIDKQWDVVRDATVALMFVLGLRQERHAEALALRELATGLCLGSPLAEARLNDNIGGVLLAQGRREPAEAEYRAALARWHEALGPDDPKVAAARSNLGNVLYIRGEYERAAAEYRAALAVAQRTLGPDHPEVAMYRSNLGEALRARKMYREAEVEQRLALAVRERALGDDHPDVASSHNNLGAALEMQGEYEAAEAEFRAALAIHQRALGADHSYVALTRANLADVLKAQGRLEEAQIEEAKLEKAKLKEAEAKQHVELAH